MKRRLIWFGLFLCLALPSTAFGQWKYGMPIREAGNLGVGFGTGTLAHGLSLKYFADSNFAIQGNLGYWRGRYWGNCKGDYCDYYRGNSFAVSVDALFEQGTLLGNSNVELAWNLGVGGGLGLSEYNDSVGAAVAGVVGLELLINAIPIDLVIEYRPNILVVPGVDLDLINFTGHVRFYF